MALSDAPIVVFDFETNGLDVAACCPVQLACLALDPVSLRVVPGSEFNTLMRPEALETVDDTEDKVKALAVNGLTRERLADAPLVGVAVKRFHDHLRGLNKKKKVYAAGFNIENFDLPLYDRLCNEHGLAEKKGGNPNFSRAAVFDLKDDLNRWWFGSDEVKNTSFDGWRRYFGMSDEGSHDALFDVRQSAWMLAKFLRLYADLRPRVQFRGSARATGGLV